MVNTPHELPDAKSVNYWKTGSSAPDTWIEKAKREIEKAGGAVLAEAYGSADGRSAYMITFTLEDQVYKIVWPVLPHEAGQKTDAKRQAATLLYHDVKARCITARVLSARVAFFSFLLLADGRTAGELARPELSQEWPPMLTVTVENQP